MGVTELQNCDSITEFENCDTKVYMTDYPSISMNQINENIPRLEKAWKLVQEGKVYLNRENSLRAIVKGSEINYIVNIAAQTCTCPDHEFRHIKCKHIWAAQLARDIQLGLITLEVKN